VDTLQRLAVELADEIVSGKKRVWPLPCIVGKAVFARGGSEADCCGIRWLSACWHGCCVTECKYAQLAQTVGLDWGNNFEVFEQLLSVEMGIAHNGRPFAEPNGKVSVPS